MNNNNHGGARAGAGRPKLEKVYLNVRVKTSVLDALDSARGDVSRSEYVETLLERTLMGKKPVTGTGRITKKGYGKNGSQVC